MGTLAVVNLILVEAEDFVASDRVRLEGRRLEHVRQVCRAKVGESLRVGELGGKVGSGRVLRLDDKAIELEVRLDRAPPAPLPVTLVLALVALAVALSVAVLNRTVKV